MKIGRFYRIITIVEDIEEEARVASRRGTSPQWFTRFSTSYPRIWVRGNIFGNA